MGKKVLSQSFFIAGLLVLFKLCVFCAAYFLVKSQGRVPDLAAWDGAYYKEIATLGYSWKEGLHGPLAFFPLFPLLVKGVMFVTQLPFEFAGIVLNQLLYGTFLVLFMLWSRQVGLRTYWLPAVFMSLDRFTLWTSIPYTEPLFLNLIMAFVLILRKFPERSLKGLFLASIVGGLASASRMVGVSLIAALGCAHLKYFLRRPHLGVLCLMLGLGGVIAYFTYVHFELGSWDMSLRTTANWGRHFSLLGFFNSLWYLIKQFYFPTILTLALAIWALIKTPPALKITAVEKWLVAWLIFIPMASSIPIGIPRYFSVIIFGPVMLAYLWEKYELKPLRWALSLVYLAEIGWQIHLLAKFYRGEVFAWAA